LQSGKGETVRQERTTVGGNVGTADFADLASASGVDYDIRWLNLMIRHHDGALHLANDALRSSASSRISKMAEATLLTQSREVLLMRRLHGLLCRTQPRPKSCSSRIAYP